MPSPLLRTLPGPDEPPNRAIQPRDLVRRDEIWDRFDFDPYQEVFKSCPQVETVCLTLHSSKRGVKHITRLPCRRVTRCGACAWARWTEKTRGLLMARAQGQPTEFKDAYDKGTWEPVIWVGTNLDRKTYNAVKSKASRLKAGTLTLTMHNGKRHVVASCDLSPRRPNPDAEQWILYESQIPAQDRIDSPTARYSEEAQAQIDMGISRFELVHDALLKAVTDDYPGEAYAGCNRISWSRHWTPEPEPEEEEGAEGEDEGEDEEGDEDSKPARIEFVAFGPIARQQQRHERAMKKMCMDLDNLTLWPDELQIYRAYMLGAGEKSEENGEEVDGEVVGDQTEQDPEPQPVHQPRNPASDTPSKNLKSPGSSEEGGVDSPGSSLNSSVDLDSVQSFEEGMRLLKEKFGIVDEG